MRLKNYDYRNRTLICDYCNDCMCSLPHLYYICFYNIYRTHFEIYGAVSSNLSGSSILIWQSIQLSLILTVNDSQWDCVYSSYEDAVFSRHQVYSAIETLNKLAKTFRILFVLRIHFFHNVECGKTIAVVIKNISSVFRQF